MTNHEYKTQKKEILLNSAQAAHQSARMQYTSAIIISTEPNYGLANSRLILAIEECIKSMILLAGYFSVPVNFEIHPFFKKHWVRPKEDANISTQIHKLSKVIDFIKTRFWNRKKSSSNIVIIVAEISLAEALQEPDKAFQAFWDKANDKKNAGFNIDFHSGHWETPADITREQYEETLRIACSFFECLRFVDELEPEDYKEIDLSSIQKIQTSIQSRNDFLQYLETKIREIITS